MKSMVHILIVAGCMALTAPAAQAAEHVELKTADWSFSGPLGRVDKPSVQRGLQVYREVCAACHGIKRVPFRRLADVGFSEAEVKALAAEYQIVDGPNDDGEMFERAGRPSDKFPSPYANEKAARATNNGAYPAELSLIVKARSDGANYLYSLLTGYSDAPAYRCEEVLDEACVKFAHVEHAEDATATEDAPEGQATGQIFHCSEITTAEYVNKETGEKRNVQACREMGQGMHYNPYFPGKQIAMPAPLITDGQVTYQDETPATVDQMAHDVVNFLQWAAEPEMQERKSMGMRVMIFLAVMTVVFFIAKRRVWKNIEH